MIVTLKTPLTRNTKLQLPTLKYVHAVLLLVNPFEIWLIQIVTIYVLPRKKNLLKKQPMTFVHTVKTGAK